MASGIVKSVKADRGFGFIRRDAGGKDIFFHVRETQPTLPFDESLVGCRVVFDIVDDPRGPKATKVVQAA